MELNRRCYIGCYVQAIPFDADFDVNVIRDSVAGTLMFVDFAGRNVDADYWISNYIADRKYDIDEQSNELVYDITSSDIRASYISFETLFKEELNLLKRHYKSVKVEYGVIHHYA